MYDLNTEYMTLFLHRVSNSVTLRVDTVIHIYESGGISFIK